MTDDYPPEQSQVEKLRDDECHELLVVWEAVRDGDSNFGELRRGETVIASMPYWQAVALAREHNKTLAALA